MNDVLVHRMIDALMVAAAVMIVVLGTPCFSRRELFDTFGMDAGEARRLQRAADAHDRLEAQPLGRRVLAGVLLAVVAVDLVKPLGSAAVLYALFFVIVAAGVARAYAHVRAAGTRRVASLRARSPLTACPWYLYVATLAVALFPLVRLRADPASSVLVTCASLLIITLAWRVSKLPPLLPGDDPVVEQFVDDRVRLARTTDLLIFVAEPTFGFLVLSSAADAPSVATAENAGLAILATVLAVVLHLMKHNYGQLRPDPAQLARRRVLDG